MCFLKKVNFILFISVKDSGKICLKVCHQSVQFMALPFAKVLPRKKDSLTFVTSVWGVFIGLKFKILVLLWLLVSWEASSSQYLLGV